MTQTQLSAMSTHFRPGIEQSAHDKMVEVIKPSFWYDPAPSVILPGDNPLDACVFHLRSRLSIPTP